MKKKIQFLVIKEVRTEIILGIDSYIYFGHELISKQ
jgi:hypothetical protein